MRENKHNALAGKMQTAFREKFNTEPLVIRSPGRINLIGEHTDYNDGFVLPAAIDKALYIAIGKNENDTCHVIAADYNDTYEAGMHALIKKEGHWSSYINGVIEQLQQHGYTIPGFNCVFGGDIPSGAGLSSSAAVECGMLFSLNQCSILVSNLSI